MKRATVIANRSSIGAFASVVILGTWMSSSAKAHETASRQASDVRSALQGMRRGVMRLSLLRSGRNPSAALSHADALIEAAHEMARGDSLVGRAGALTVAYRLERESHRPGPGIPLISDLRSPAHVHDVLMAIEEAGDLEASAEIDALGSERQLHRALDDARGFVPDLGDDLTSAISKRRSAMYGERLGEALVDHFHGLRWLEPVRRRAQQANFARWTHGLPKGTVAARAMLGTIATLDVVFGGDPSFRGAHALVRSSGSPLDPIAEPWVLRLPIPNGRHVVSTIASDQEQVSGAVRLLDAVVDGLRASRPGIRDIGFVLLPHDLEVDLSNELWVDAATRGIAWANRGPDERILTVGELTDYVQRSFDGVAWGEGRADLVPPR